jgi:hypothetical protein
VSNPVKVIVAVAAVLLIGGGVAAYQASNTADQAKTESTAQSSDTKSTTEKTEPKHENEHPDTAGDVTYKGVEGKTALELLKASHKVETKTYEGIGELVTSIDGVAPDSKHFWALYVNDAQSQVGASQYVTKATDTITWKLEEITQ